MPHEHIDIGTVPRECIVFVCVHECVCCACVTHEYVSCVMDVCACIVCVCVCVCVSEGRKRPHIKMCIYYAQ